MGIPDIFESDGLWSCKLGGTKLDFIIKVKILKVFFVIFRMKGRGKISDNEVPLKSKFTKNVIQVQII